jgi:hypothetical protein
MSQSDPGSHEAEVVNLDARRPVDPAEVALQRLGAALPGPPLVLRVAVAVLSVVQAVMVIPWIVGRDPWNLLDTMTEEHLTRDGALGLAVAAAGVLTVWRWRWAVPCFAIAAVATIAQAVAAAFDDDLAGGASTELVHIPSVVLTCLIGVMNLKLRPLGGISR